MKYVIFKKSGFILIQKCIGSVIKNIRIGKITPKFQLLDNTLKRSANNRLEISGLKG